MKCPHCGSNLNLEDAYCSYCGRPNEHAQKHAEDMKRYQHEFTKTQTEIYSKSRRLASLTAPLLILIVLIVFNIAAFFFQVFSWDIGQAMLERRIEANREAHQERIDAYLADGDYHGLSSYYNTNNLYSSEEFDRYTAVVSVADNYFSVYRQLVNLEREREYSHFEEDLPQRLKSIADHLDWIYNVEKDYSYRAEEYLTDDMMAVIEDIRTQTGAILIAYGGLTKEETDELRDLSYAKRMELLERGMMR